jgi:formylglycine-generating enzyme required for sulfatase activity
MYRGGGWHGAAGLRRPAYRSSITQDFRLNIVGFRLALSPE